MELGRCYHFAVAWAFEARAEGDLTLSEPEPGTGGMQGFQFTPPQGVSTLCADRAGGLTVHIRATSPQGHALNGELLEYALVVGSARESGAERQARQDGDRQRREAARAQMEANIYNAELDRGGEALARGCSRCRTLYHVCLSDRRAASGTRDGAGGDPLDEAHQICHLQFESCAQSAAPFLVDRRGRHACNSPID